MMQGNNREHCQATSRSFNLCCARIRRSAIVNWRSSKAHFLEAQPPSCPYLLPLFLPLARFREEQNFRDPGMYRISYFVIKRRRENHSRRPREYHFTYFPALHVKENSQLSSYRVRTLSVNTRFTSKCAFAHRAILIKGDRGMAGRNGRSLTDSLARPNWPLWSNAECLISRLSNNWISVSDLGKCASCWYLLAFFKKMCQ